MITARSAGQIDLAGPYVGMRAVPGDERGGRQAARQVLPGDAQRLVGCGADRVDDGVVVCGDIGVSDVPTDLHVEVHS